MVVLWHTFQEESNTRVNSIELCETSFKTLGDCLCQPVYVFKVISFVKRQSHIR